MHAVIKVGGATRGLLKPRGIVFASSDGVTAVTRRMSYTAGFTLEVAAFAENLGIEVLAESME